MKDFMWIYLASGKTIYIRKSAVIAVESIDEDKTAALINNRKISIDESFESFMERLEEDN